MNETRDIPLYKCHKVVRALKILSMIEHVSHVLLTFRNHNSLTIEQPYDVNFRRISDDQGYLVIYEDGYQSWSPTKAFEAGYKRL